MNEFTERFKKLPNHRLLRILESAEQYQGEAVEAARAELAQRSVSEEELASFRSQVEQETAQKEARNTAKKALEAKAEAVGQELLHTVNPIQVDGQSTARRINLLALLFGGLAAYEVFSSFGFLRYMLTSFAAEWDLYSVLELLPMVLLPVIAVSLFLRKPTGWELGAAYLIVINVSLLVGLIYSTLGLIRASSESTMTEYGEGVIVLLNDHYSPFVIPPDPVQYCLALLFYGGLLYALASKRVRSELSIDFQRGITALALAIAALIFFFWLWY